jgi:hypothetical protein
VCGKAWHHEDKSDYGDMTKCAVQLAMVGDTLEFRYKMLHDGPPDPSDPDASSPPIVADADTAATCAIKVPKDAGFGDWMTYVFARPAKEAK